MSRYDTAYEEFNSKYKVDFNIRTEYNGANQIASIDDFSMEASSTIKDREVYISTLTSTLSSYLMKKIKIEAGKSYDLSDIDLGGFITEFDKVVNAIRSDEAETENKDYYHRSFEGLNLNQVASAVWNRAGRAFNRPLHEIWAGQIRKGKLMIEQLQGITTGATSVLDGMLGPDSGYNSSADRDLGNVILAKNAMEMAISKRSWISYLNPFNWGPYSRESDYLKDLKAKLLTYQGANFPIDSVVPESVSGNILDNAYTALMSYVENNGAANPSPNRREEDVNTSVSESLNDNSNVKENIMGIDLGDQVHTEKSEFISTANDERVITNEKDALS